MRADVIMALHDSEWDLPSQLLLERLPQLLVRSHHILWLPLASEHDYFREALQKLLCRLVEQGDRHILVDRIPVPVELQQYVLHGVVIAPREPEHPTLQDNAADARTELRSQHGRVEEQRRSVNRSCGVTKHEDVVEVEFGSDVCSPRDLVTVVHYPSNGIAHVLDGLGVLDLRYQAVIRYDDEDPM